MFVATSAYAQITESDIEYEPGSNETIQRITSTFEVKRAVIGLLIIAAMAGILFFFYWYKTGQWARERHNQRIAENSRLLVRSKSTLGEKGFLDSGTSFLEIRKSQQSLFADARLNFRSLEYSES